MRISDWRSDVVSSDLFLTPPGEFSDMIAGAITQATGLGPELSTSGGTSDARFLSRLCPVVEFGLCNATMHKLDQAVAVGDLETLTDVYDHIRARAFGNSMSCEHIKFYSQQSRV